MCGDSYIRRRVVAAAVEEYEDNVRQRVVAQDNSKLLRVAVYTSVSVASSSRFKPQAV